MFRCFIGQGSMNVSDLGARVDDWVSSNAEWANDSVAHTLTERNTKLDGTGTTYYGIDVRFLKDDTKDNLLQKFTDKLKDKVAWYGVGYHDCTHDESDPHACSWDDKTEWADKDVTIPVNIPNLEVT